MFKALFGDDGALKLAKLRKEPEAAVQESGFVVEEAAEYDGRSEGGACTIECSSAGTGIYKLTPSGGSGSDYYFPYLPQGTNGGVSQCRVPSSVPDGTIVLTGAMNGCSLDVALSGDTLLFRHDGNGVSMAGLPAGDPRRGGQPRCRVDSRLYMIDGIEQNMAAAVGTRSTAYKSVGAMPVHFLISVKTNGAWLVVHSGLMVVQTSSSGKMTTSYERLPGLSTLTASFS